MSRIKFFLMLNIIISILLSGLSNISDLKDIQGIFDGYTISWKFLGYLCGISSHIFSTGEPYYYWIAFAFGVAVLFLHLIFAAFSD